MPSIKMKTNLTSGCLKEKCGLHVCQKSILISKNVTCPGRVYQMVEDIYNCTQINKDGIAAESLALKEDLGGPDQDVVSDELASTEHLSDTVSDNGGYTSSTCSSNIGTISHVLEFVDFYSNEEHDVSVESQGSVQSSCEIQDYNLSDFCISDMSFSLPHPGCNLEIGNDIETTFPSNYECEESSLLCDLKQDFMVLPFLEDVIDPESDFSRRPSEETFVTAENSNFYISQNFCSGEQGCNGSTCPILEHDLFDPQVYIKILPDQSDLASAMLPCPELNEKLKDKRITLVLDLDETLVHSTLDAGGDSDFKFTVFFNQKDHVVYVKQRPHLQTFLKRVAEMFEIVVFTASQSIYAKQILDTLDPDGVIISRRAYRDSCTVSGGIYLKDLTILGVDFAKIAIVDNSPQVFRLQVNNGIPIKSWFDDPSDTALISLLPFLETLVDADDVRPIIAKKFGNKE